MRKTSIVLATLKILLAKKLARRVLVLAELNVATDAWPPELDKWEDFKNLTYRVAHGKDLDAALRDPEAQIVIMNFEGLRRLVARRPVPKKLGKFTYALYPDFRGARWPFDVLVVDESTRLKHARTDRFRRLRVVLPLFNRRYLLTGTPTPKGYLDLFGQIYLLDLGRALGRYITHYRNRWFSPSGYGGHTWTIQGTKAQKEIEAAIAPMILRLASAKLQKLPPLRGAFGFARVRPRVDWVDLPIPVMRSYRRLQHEFFVALDKEVVSAKNAGVAAMKCRQLANGSIYVDQPVDPTIARRTRARTTTHVHNAKVDRLLEILDERGFRNQPVMIAYEFLHDLGQLREALGDDLPALGGGMKRDKFREIREAWNTGSLPRLAVQPQTVAHGLNLQSAGYGIIFFGLSWDTEAYTQLVRRLWRSGRVAPVYIRHIAARYTVDEIILDGLGRDLSTQNNLLAALERYRERHK